MSLRATLPLLLWFPGVALAVPRTLEHQGRLLEPSGASLSGTVTLDVALYDAPSGGAPRFTERFVGVPVVDGYYDVVLGAASTPLEDDDLDGGPRYLGVAVNEGGELAPRTPLSSVPYAIRADVAERPVGLSLGDCGAPTGGALGFDPSTRRLYLCDGQGWGLIGQVSTPPGGWLAPSRAWRRRLDLQGATGAGPGYAVKLRVGADAAAGGDVHLGGHSLQFPTGEGQGGDLAFFDAATGQPLSFWVESVASGVATVWVRVDEDLGTDRTIALYYGDATAVNLASGAETFPLFDTFSGSAIDPTRWVVSGTASVSGGQLTVGDSVQDHDTVDSIQTFGAGYQAVWRGRINNEGWTSANDGFRSVVAFHTVWNNSSVLTWFTTVQTTSGSRGGTYHFAVQRRPDGTPRMLLDGVVQPVGAGSSTALSAMGWHAGTGTDLIDYVFVTPFVFPEPALALAHPEESP